MVPHAIDVSCKARNAFRIPARDSIDDDEFLMDSVRLLWVNGQRPSQQRKNACNSRHQQTSRHGSTKLELSAQISTPAASGTDTVGALGAPPDPRHTAPPQDAQSCLQAASASFRRTRPSSNLGVLGAAVAPPRYLS
ncbi:hypothetical protein BC826DRAFT_1012715 [Russula brevipes]|nr:hypothetical protein BC826DRAFT_1012715 [Russula brevipes]